MLITVFLADTCSSRLSEIILNPYTVKSLIHYEVSYVTKILVGR
jgi:hypothetical protein